MEKDSIYFIAIIPPQEICQSITAFRLDFADRFNSKAALKIIPHITLKSPFKLTTADQRDPRGWFQALTLPTGPFQLELKGFGIFDNKRQPVIFVNPVLNAPLSALQKEIIRSFQFAYPEIPVTIHELNFHPHITIAYRDLSFANFSEAWEEYKRKEYQAIFDVDNLALLQHDGRLWNVIDSHFFK